MSVKRQLKPGKTNPGVSVRALAEGAMLTALTLILAVISVYVPILNLVAIFLFPAPLALLVLRQGLKYGCIGAVSVFLLSAMLMGLPQALFLFISYGFLGLFFGWCFRNHKKALFTLLIGVLISFLATILLLQVSTIIGVSMEQLREAAATIYRDYEHMAEQQGVASILGDMSVEEAVEFAIKLLPFAFFIWAMVLSFICYKLMTSLLRRLGNDIPQLPPFREWRLHPRLLWLMIIALFGSSLCERLQLGVFIQIANNLLYSVSLIFAISGLAVLLWILWRFKIHMFIRVLAVFFSIQLFSGFLLIIAGVFDPLFNFRELLENYANKSKQINL